MSLCRDAVQQWVTGSGGSIIVGPSFSLGHEADMSDTTPIIRGIGLTVADYAPGSIGSDLDRIEALGFSHAEIAIGPTLTITNGQLDPNRLALYVRQTKGRRLGYTVHGSHAINFMDTAHYDLHMAVCRASIDFCAAIGSDILVLHPGWLERFEPEPTLARLVAQERQALRQLGDVAQAAGVRLCVENMPPIPETFREGKNNYAFDPARLAAQIEAVGHPNVCATIDFSHAWVAQSWHGRDYLESLKPLAPWANHLHIHDSFGRLPTVDNLFSGDAIAYGQGDLHLPPGLGTLPYETILPHLAVRPQTVITLEMIRPYRDDATLSKALETTRHYAALLERAALADHPSAAEMGGASAPKGSVGEHPAPLSRTGTEG